MTRWWLAPWYDRLVGSAEYGPLGRWRAELLAEVSGRVLEVGAGTGANLPHYTDAVDVLTICEPDSGMSTQMEGKLAAEPPFDVVHAEVVGEALPVEDASQDVVVCTLVLCTVVDVAAVLEEIRRVLRPGGRYVFIEHVAAEDSAVKYATQRAITPVWKLFAGGCCLDRKTADAIEASGMAVEWLENRAMPGFAGVTVPAIVGVARA